jgi:MFS family permease
MAIIGTLAYEFQVTIPLMAHSGFHLGATGFGLLYAAMGAGAVVSGITLAGKVPGRVRTLAIAAAAFGIALTAAAVAPTPVTEGICLAFVGAASVVFSSSTNATLQIRADPSMRGRVVALYIMAFMGSTAIGGPLVGVAAELLGPRASLGVGAAGCAAGVLLALALGSGAQTRAGVRPGYDRSSKTSAIVRRSGPPINAPSSSIAGHRSTTAPSLSPPASTSDP